MNRLSISSRRGFIRQNSLLGLGIMALGIKGRDLYAGSQTQKKLIKKAEGQGAEAKVENLGALTLEELRKQYNKYLFDDFVPNMDALVIDHQYGGFMCNVDIKNKKRISGNKSSWFEGRGLWVYSFLYNNFGKDNKFLKVAEKSKDFILKNIIAGRDIYTDKEFFPSSFNQNGTQSSAGGDIYGNLFVAEGFSEYAYATGDEKLFSQAKAIILECMRRYDQPDYNYKGVAYGVEGAPNEWLGARVNGHWMIFLRAATQILRHRKDKEIEEIADRCVDAIMNRHLNADYRLINEILNHDFSLPNNLFNQFSYVGHGIETLWMVMDEARRRNDLELFNRASAAFRRHVDIAEDRIYGGFFRSLDNVDNNTFKMDKVLWLQEEVLNGALIMYEQTGDNWARDCFERTYQYVQDKFATRGLAFWPETGEREVSTELQMDRAEHYHHPRQLMLGILSLDRMIAKNK